MRCNDKSEKILLNQGFEWFWFIFSAYKVRNIFIVVVNLLIFTSITVSYRITCKLRSYFSLPFRRQRKPFINRKWVARWCRFPQNLIVFFVVRIHIIFIRQQEVQFSTADKRWNWWFKYSQFIINHVNTVFSIWLERSVAIHEEIDILNLANFRAI